MCIRDRPECDLANFVPYTRFPEVNRCVPRKGFEGHCDHELSLLRLSKSYIKNNTGKNKASNFALK